MGYTTAFTGQIGLSRKLAFAEAKLLVELADMDRSEAKAITGHDAYMQWVPTEALDAIVWDGNEKFYDYEALLRWLCGWLSERGVQANGSLLWRGEDSSDVGEILVEANQVVMKPGKKASAKAGKPLTLNKLGEMAIKIVAEGGATEGQP